MHNLTRFMLAVAVFASVPSLVRNATARPGISNVSATDVLTQNTFLGEPFAWVGSIPPSDGESEDLLTAAQFAFAVPWPTGLQALEAFITNYPASSWIPSVHAHLGKAYRESGRDTLALQHWETAWVATSGYSSGAGKHVGDYTLAHWAQLLSSLGRYETLLSLSGEAQGRILDHGPLSQMWARTREATVDMGLRPGASYRCGTYALYGVATALGLNFDRRAIMSMPSPATGFSMQNLADFSSRLGLGLAPVHRDSGTQIAVPCVIHWSQNHYGAILALEKGLYRVVDPTFVHPRYMTPDTVNAEASGYFLVPLDRLPPGYRQATYAEMGTVFGRGQPNKFLDENDQTYTCDEGEAPPGSDGTEGKFPKMADLVSPGAQSASGTALSLPVGSCGTCGGMPVWRISEPYLNIWLHDQPLGAYQPALGSSPAFTLSYKQRADRGLPGSSVGKNWHSSWLSVIDASVYKQYYTTFSFTVLYANGGYGEFDYADAVGTNYWTNLKLWAQTNSSGVLTNLQLLHPDGSVEIYGFNPTNAIGSSYYYLSQRISADGFSTLFIYDPYDPAAGSVRLRYVVDANGGTNTLSYSNNDNTNLITQVTDCASDHIVRGI